MRGLLNNQVTFFLFIVIANDGALQLLHKDQGGNDDAFTEVPQGRNCHWGEGGLKILENGIKIMYMVKTNCCGLLEKGFN